MRPLDPTGAVMHQNPMARERGNEPMRDGCYIKAAAATNRIVDTAATARA